MTVKEVTKEYCMHCTHRSTCAHPCPTVLGKILFTDKGESK